MRHPLDSLANWPDTLTLLLVDTAHVWQIPAAIGGVGFNDYPAPDAHCAILRHFASRYGARLFSWSPDATAVAISRPPVTDAAAFAAGD